MKVTINNESKKYITLEMLPAARRVVSELKSDESTAADYAVYAVNAICEAFNLGYCVKVLEVSARVAGNCRAFNSLFDGSGNLDVWIEGTAKCADGFCEFGAYLTDIWNLTGDNASLLARQYMFKTIYRKGE